MNKQEKTKQINLCKKHARVMLETARGCDRQGDFVTGARCREQAFIWIKRIDDLLLSMK